MNDRDRMDNFLGWLLILFIIPLCMVLLVKMVESYRADRSDLHARPFQVQLPEGGTVTCVSYKDAMRSGLSCDWEHIKP